VERKVIALGVKRLGNDAAALNRARDARGVQARRIDERADMQPRRLRAADFRLETPATAPRRDERGAEREGRSRRLRIAPQRQHVGVAVEDAGRRRQQRADAGEIRLHRLRLGARQQFQPLDAIGGAAARQRLQPAEFALVGGDDQLAAAPMRDAMRLAIGIEPRPALDAEPRLQAARGVIDAGVDHLAVARRGLLAGRGARFHHDDGAAGERQRARDCEADDARADDERVDVAHGAACVSISRGCGSTPQPRSRPI
jgi:hypothetical protein